MSISSLQSKLLKKNHLHPVEGDWTGTVRELHDLVICYTHTPRTAPAIVDLEKSTKAEAITKEWPLLVASKDDEGMETFTFAGAEVFWNNKLRCSIIANGLDKYVPQVLYLIRPETAFTSCLHFLARELGGMKSYEEQRGFIFCNPGIVTLMTPFWLRVQETCWSGGFSPGISANDRAALLLALMECFILSPTDSKTNRELCPCPYVPLETLHAAGVFLPSIEFPDQIPTPSAHTLITESNKRTNFSGIPTNLTNYIECCACGSFTAPVGETNKHPCIPKEDIKCTGCGLVFHNTNDYKVHAMTFCHQGSTSQAKCACCGVMGPKCYCQQHWQKTYSLVTAALRGSITRATWLARSTKEIPLLIDAKTYLGWDLVKQSNQTPTRPPSPMRLKESLWDHTVAPFPQCIMVGDEPQLSLPQSKDSISFTRIHETLEQTLNVRMTHIEHKPQPKLAKTPKGTSKAMNEAALKAYQEKHIGNSGITEDNARPEDLETLSDKIELTEEKLADDKSANILSMALGMNIDEIKEEVKQLKDLRSIIAASIDLATNGWNVKRQLFKDEDSEASETEKDEDQHNNSDNGEGEEERRKEKGEGKVESKEESGGRFFCRNEGHSNEVPPYRTFRTEGEKTAHLCRAHSCPYKKNTPPCHFFYEMEIELGNHLIKSHPNLGDKDHCPICDALVDKEHLLLHMRSVHNKCTNCQRWFEDLPALKRHWDSHGGACTVAKAEDKPSTSDPTTPAMEPLTLAKLPDLKVGHEGLLTEALSIILDTAMPSDNKEAKEKAKDLINSYTFHQNHQRNISRNHYTALSQTALFLEIPSFVHPPNSKERGFDKALDAAQIVELSPYTSERFSNFLKMENLHSKMLNYIKQYYLTEPSSVYLFLNHLSQDNVDVLKASYRRHPYELTYLEVYKVLQTRFYNLDLKTLRDSVGNLKRGPHEHPVSFHTRVYKLCNLASVNFTEAQKAVWIENKVRDVFYRSLDTNLRMEVDQIESKNGVTMSSTELLETFVCRANLKSTLDFNEDTLISVARIHERKQAPKRSNRVNMISAPNAPKPVVRKESRKPTSASAPPWKMPPAHTQPTSTRQSNLRGNPAGNSRGQTPYQTATRHIRQISPLHPRTMQRQSHRQSTPQTRIQGQGPPITPQRHLPLSRARPQPEFPQRSTQFRPPAPGTRMAEKHNSIVKTLGSMGLTIASLEKDGNFCWSCGAGRRAFSSKPYHPRRQCSLPIYNGPPHTCQPNKRLLHEAKDCPERRQRVTRVRLED